ncbi:glyoxalase [Enterococcus malodoratus]|nr:glyoxalase [Enterococcus malodoratus]
MLENFQTSFILRENREDVFMSKPDFSAIHHVAIIVSDYQKAKHFYVTVLGLPIIRENFRPERQDYKLDLQLNDAELEIFAVQNPPKRPSFPEAAGLRHLAFKTEDIEATIAYLNSHGIDCEPLRTDDFTGERMTFFFDPDGLPLELHE